MEEEKVIEIIYNIFYFIVDPHFTGWLLVIKIVITIITVLMVAFIIGVAAWKTDWLDWAIRWDLKEFLSYRPYGVGKFTKQWTKIKQRLERGARTGLDSEYKLAIIEADDLLKTAFRRLGVGLETLEETLRKRIGPDTISNYEEVKKVHQIRNEIILDPNYKLDLEKTKEILNVYEKALKELTVL